MSHTTHLALCSIALALAAAPAGLAQTSRTLPPVLSTEASPPTGARAEPAQMSGYPLQVGDLPPGVVAIRVIRESFQTNVPDQVVLLRVGTSARVLSGTTNSEGRVQFDGLQVGESVRVRAVVGPETLESQQFEIPAQGGVRMVLVAGVGAGAASAADPWPPAMAAATSAPTAPPPLSLPPAAAAPPAVTPMVTAAAPIRETSSVGGIGLVAGVVVLFVVAAVWLGRRRLAAASERDDLDVEEPVRNSRPEPIVVGNPLTLPRMRDDVFEELVRLEKSYSAGRANQGYAARREALIGELLALDVSHGESGDQGPVL